MRKLLLIASLLISIAQMFAFPVHITSWNIKDDIKKLNALHISVDYVNISTQTIIAYVPRTSEFEKLLANGFQAEIMPDAAKENHNDTANGNTRAYHTLDEYHAFMQSMPVQYPNLCQLVQFGSSALNRPLYMLKISDNVQIEENEPEFRYISSIHGDEVVGFENCIRLIQLLTSQYSTNTRISNIVNNTEIWICPMFNPDGYVAHERYNDNGADLNRNFPEPDGTQHADGMSWQPETLAMMDFGNNHSINLSANFHGGALVTNYPWDYTYTLCPDNDLFIQLAHSYADHNLPMHNSTEFFNGITNGAAWYIAEGTIQDWVYWVNKCMDLTIELGNDKWPAASQLDTFWNDNQESMLTYLEFVQKGIQGTVTNTAGTPLNAIIHLSANGMDIKTDPQVGDYHRVLLPGTYNVSATADGYATVTETITVPATGSVTHNFVLSPIELTNYTGSVINTQGIVVPNASVTLHSISSTHQSQTNSEGVFTYNDIPQGDYTLTASANGFGVFEASVHLDDSHTESLIVLPGTVFSDNFESGLAYWTSQTPWAIIAQTDNHVLTDSPSGNYSNNITRNIALTNPVSLNNVLNPLLVIDVKYNLESGYDFVNIQGSANGTSWTNLTQLTGYQSQWQTLSLPLTSYQNGNFYLRFQIDTDYGSTDDGIYIDNVRISGTQQQQIICGDIDSNRLIDLDDAAYTLQFSVGNDPIPLIDPLPWDSDRIEAADVDNDNVVTATDSYYIYSKTKHYDGAFPAQGGNAIPMQNPDVSISIVANEIRITAQHPEFVKSLSLNFSSLNELQIPNIEWLSTLDNANVASSADNKTIGLYCLQDAQIPALIASLEFNASGNQIHCSGLVNNFPINTDIYPTSDSDSHITPIITDLMGNYPNPFIPNTEILYSVSKNNTPVELTIYNAKGQLVKTLVSKLEKSGVHSITWNGTNNQNRTLGNGIYYYRFQTPEKTMIKKMVMLK